MKIFFREIGSGFPLIILHGLYGSSDNWMSIARRVSDRFRVIVPDLRNHGKSLHSPDHTYRLMVEDIVQFAQENNLEKFHLLGHSMGGKVAMMLSLLYPEMVEKLIVVDIAPKDYSGYRNFGNTTSRHDFILQSLMSLDISNYSNRNDIDEALTEIFQDKSLRAFLLKNVGRNDDGSFRWILNLDVLSRNLNEILDGFSDFSASSSTPALFLRGALSPYITDDDSFYIKKYFPSANIVRIDNAGHWLHAEQPEKLINILGFFL